jgi:thiamine biosynthesis lipoprotein
VTSGTYERFLIQDGVKYHHILDPATGWPINNDVLSVTIIADKGSAADADGLSTTCLALGVEKGMELIESLNHMGVEAVFVDAEGEIHKTEGAPELTTN